MADADHGSRTRNIIVGVTGSIAAYKACSVVRGLTARGHAVQVVMTDAAQKFVTALSFRALSRRPVVTSLWIDESDARLVHIELAEWVDVLAVVPATASIIAKFHAGIADDILTCTWLAADCPKVVAPAMNDRMWKAHATHRNVAGLREIEGIHIVDPVEGRLASGKVARGHLAPINDIIERVHQVAQSVPDADAAG
jgi:phosphopantothenoylcysteine decarboxylase/phosphopantothenate--cysteine ligase